MFNSCTIIKVREMIKENDMLAIALVFGMLGVVLSCALSAVDAGRNSQKDN